MRDRRAGPHGQLVNAGLVDFSADAENPGAAVLGKPLPHEPVRAVQDDGRDVGQGLDVVDDRRRTEKPDDGRERGLEPRMSPLAFQGLEQGRLFAADVGPRAAVDEDVEVEPRPEDVFPQEVLQAGVGDGRLQPPGDGFIFAADVDIRRVDAHGVRGDDDPLEEKVGIVEHDIAVLERPRLPLVGVDAQIPGTGQVLRDEPPLDAGRESRPAPAAEIRRLHFAQDLGGRHLQGLADGRVAAPAQVNAQVVEVGRAEVPGEDLVVHSLNPTRPGSGRSPPGSGSYNSRC